MFKIYMLITIDKVKLHMQAKQKKKFILYLPLADKFIHFQESRVHNS